MLSRLRFPLVLGCLAMTTGCVTPQKPASAPPLDEDSVTVTGTRVTKEQLTRSGQGLTAVPRNGTTGTFDYLKKALGAEAYPGENEYKTCSELLSALQARNIPIESVSTAEVVTLTPKGVKLGYRYDAADCPVEH